MPTLRLPTLPTRALPPAPPPAPPPAARAPVTTSKHTLASAQPTASNSQRLPGTSEQRALVARPQQRSVAPRTATPSEGTLIRAAAAQPPATIAARQHGRPGRSWMAGAGVVLLLLLMAAFGLAQALRGDGARPASGGTHLADALARGAVGTPAPSGSIPAGIWVASAGAVIYIPPAPTPIPSNATFTAATQPDFAPCHDTYMFVPNITQWTVPPGCYGNVYVPNPANYPSRPIFGFCNWWVMQNHLSNPRITMGGEIYQGTTPVAGEAIFFDGLVQGASREGHWAQLVAIAPDHYWMLISEMNFAWRGAGFGRIDYRYVHAGPGIKFYS